MTVANKCQWHFSYRASKLASVYMYWSHTSPIVILKNNILTELEYIQDLKDDIHSRYTEYELSIPARNREGQFSQQ